MQIVLGVTGRVHVHHQGDAIDVNAARGNVCGNQRWRDAVAEGLQSASAHSLGLTTVQRTCGNALRGHVRGESIHACLCAHEEDRATVTCTDLRGDEFLVHRMNEHHVVIHGLHGGRSWRQRVSHRVVHVGLADDIDIAIESRAEQQALASRLGEVKDLADDRHEAHVGHLIGLVQHSDLHAAEVN